MTGLKKFFKELTRYPSAILGLSVIVLLLGISVYALATIPYSEAVRLWRGGEDIWYQNPKYAPPSWFNEFTTKKRPVSFKVNTYDGSLSKTTTPSSDPEISTIDMSYAFDYEYDGSPQEMMIYFKSNIIEKLSFVSITWLTPDGRTIRIADMAISNKDTYRFTQDPKLQKRLKVEAVDVMNSLFEDPESPGKILKGEYQLVITGTSFESASTIDAEFVINENYLAWPGRINTAAICFYLCYMEPRSP